MNNRLLHQISLSLPHWIALSIIFFLSGCTTYHVIEKPHQLSLMSQLQPRYVAITHGQLEYYEFGKGTPIVLIAGYATDITSWNKPFLFYLAQQHRVIVFNNRHVGRSYICSSGCYTSKDMAQDTHQLIKNLHLHQPAILGISMGGMIAQQVAVNYPKDISSLILINTAISGKRSVHPNPLIKKMMLNLPPNKLSFYLIAVNHFFSPRWCGRMIIRTISDRFQPRNRCEIDLAKVIPQQKIVLENWMNDEITANKLYTLPVPVLILNGESDQIIPPINSVILKTTIPHTQLLRFCEGGHAMIYQYPKELAEAINHFV